MKIGRSESLFLFCIKMSGGIPRAYARPDVSRMRQYTRLLGTRVQQERREREVGRSRRVGGRAVPVSNYRLSDEQVAAMQVQARQSLQENEIRRAMDTLGRREYFRQVTARARPLNLRLRKKMDDGEICPISLDPLGYSGEARNPVDVIELRPCGHYLNADSFEPWVNMNSGCPLCRADVNIAKRFTPVIELSD